MAKNCPKNLPWNLNNLHRNLFEKIVPQIVRKIDPKTFYTKIIRTIGQKNWRTEKKQGHRNLVEKELFRILFKKKLLETVRKIM